MNPSQQDPQALLQLFLGLKAGRKDKANQVLARALKGDPNQAAAYALLIGGLLAQNGQDDEAVPLYQEAKRLNPSEPAAYFYLGVAFHALKKKWNHIKPGMIWRSASRATPLITTSAVSD